MHSASLPVVSAAPAAAVAVRTRAGRAPRGAGAGRYLDELRAGIETALSAAYERLGETFMPDAPAEELWRELVAGGQGGKRLRPLLLVMAYEGYAGRIPPAVWQAAAGIEMFHAFALIHDDILDRSAERRQRPTLHARLAQRFGGPRAGDGAGADLAMLAGDALYSYALGVFARLALPPERVARALQLITEAAVVTGLGVFAEVVCRNREARLSNAELFALYDRKTGAYTFRCPLQVGAVLAGADDAELRRLAEFGRHLGRAYQLRDDLDDTLALLAGAGAGRDLPQEILLWFPLQLARRALPAGDGRELEALCFAAGRMPADRARLAALLRVAGALAATAREAQRALRQATAAGRRLALDARVRRELLRYCRSGIWRGRIGDYLIQQ